MANHVSFPSIEQYRNVVKTVRERCAYHGVPLPKLKFTGTVKLHGTNSGIGFDFKTGELWAQSRNNVITPDADNAGFARWVEENQDFWRAFFTVWKTMVPETKDQKVVVYGEWCGQGIMKGVAISQIGRKIFVIFDAVIVTDEQEADGHPVKKTISPIVLDAIADELINEDDGAYPVDLFDVWRFDTFSVVIDFANPELSQNYLASLTEAVEKECPAGKYFGVTGVGEGIVWRCTATQGGLPYRTDDLIFKVKGEKHSDTKVKTLATVDPVKLENVGKFVEATVTDHRLEKGIAFLRETTEFPFDLKNLGAFLKWVGSDILKEEADTLEASGLSRQDVMPKVSAAAKQWFLDHPVSYEEGQ